MEPYWRQTDLSWLALRPDHAEELASPLTNPPDPATHALCARLLSVAGTRVAVQFVDAWACPLVLERGSLLDVPGVVRRPGEPNRCHENSAALWLKSPGAYRFATGWALARDVWRRHSWVLDAAGWLFETTLPQEAYFGVVLDLDQAGWFASALLLPA
jgi:hypothetical protein